MEAHLNRNMKTAKMKERIKSKAEANAKAKEQEAASSSTMDAKPAISEEELLKIFSTGEKVEKTPRGAKPPPQNTNNSSGKKKKGKK